MNIDLQSIEYTALLKLFEDICHAYRRAQAQKRNVQVCGFWADLFNGFDKEINRRLAAGFDNEEGCR